MGYELQPRGRVPVQIDPRLLTLDQAGEYIGAPASFVKKLIAEGVLTSVQLFGVTKVDVADLDRMIDASAGARATMRTTKRPGDDRTPMPDLLRVAPLS